MTLSLVTVGYGGSTPVQLLGVCFSSLQGGLGEASFLALTSLYDTPRALTAWSSGTGFAGIFGYAWVFFLKFALGLSFRATLVAANLLAVAWLCVYFWLLSDPHIPRDSGGRDTVCSSDSSHAPGGAYSALPDPRSSPSPSLNGNGGRHRMDLDGEGGRGEAGGAIGGSFGADVETVEARQGEMTAGERFCFTLGLWRFMVPLMLVYFAEVRGICEGPNAKLFCTDRNGCVCLHFEGWQVLLMHSWCCFCV